MSKLGNFVCRIIVDKGESLMRELSDRNSMSSSNNSGSNNSDSRGNDGNSTNSNSDSNNNNNDNNSSNNHTDNRSQSNHKPDLQKILSDTQIQIKQWEKVAVICTYELNVLWGEIVEAALRSPLLLECVARTILSAGLDRTYDVERY